MDDTLVHFQWTKKICAIIFLLLPTYAMSSLHGLTTVNVVCLFLQHPSILITIHTTFKTEQSLFFQGITDLTQTALSIIVEKGDTRH